MPRTHRCVGVLLAVAFGTGAHTALAWGQVRYTVQDLGQVNGIGSSASAINDAGEVVGWMLTPLEDSRATRTGAGLVFESLPGLEGVSSDAEGINATGDIAGSYQVSAYPNWAMHAMRYTRAGIVEDLGTLGGPSSFGFDINRLGQVSGCSQVSTTPYVTRGFIATPGAPLQNLGTLSGGTYASSCAGHINDSGQVAGQAETANGRYHAFRYTAGVGLEDLGTPVDADSFGDDINEAGQVVGRVISAAGTHAFLYTDGTGMVDLHALGTESDATSLNDRGDVVGYFRSSGQLPRAFLYTDAAGMIDLNSAIDGTAGWVLNYAFGINAAGEIVGQGMYLGQSQPRAFKLILVVPDTTPPTIVSSTADPSVLWPPDGRMAGVRVAITATDDVDQAPRCFISGVSSNEPGTQADVVVTDALTLQLRATRDGAGLGRLYGVAVTCSDVAGNQAETVVSVSVPHDTKP